MAVTSRTLALLAELSVELDAMVDAHTDQLTAAWVRAWDLVRDDLTVAVLEQLTPSERTRVRLQGRILTALNRISQQLDELADHTQVLVTGSLGQVASAAITAQTAIIASQLPVSWDRPFNSLQADALDAMIHRTTERITADTRPLSTDAMRAVRDELVKGVGRSDNPVKVARQIVRNTEGAFNGGLTRAMTIARTELLDTSRTAAEQWQGRNSDVIGEWQWLASMSLNTCAACWAMNGTLHPLSEPGPLDHQNGRCTRVAVTKSWRSLGIDLDEPASSFPDAESAFRNLSRTDQLRIMGPGRMEALDSGTPWDALATRRTTEGWRDSYAPTPVRDLVAATT